MTVAAFLHARQQLRDAARAYAFALATEEEAVRAFDRAKVVLQRATLTREIAEARLDLARERLPAVYHASTEVPSARHTLPQL